MNTTAQLQLGSNILLYPGLTSSGVAGGVNGPYFNVNVTNNAEYPGYALNITSTAANNNMNPAAAANFSGGLNVSPGVFGINYTGANTIDYRPVNIAYTINNLNANSRTATGIFLNAIETGSGLNGMTHNLMDLQVGGNPRFRVQNTGRVRFGSQGNGPSMYATDMSTGGGAANVDGLSLEFAISSSTPPTAGHSFSGNFTHPTGPFSAVRMGSIFQPSSGTAVFNYLAIENGTINQTGGANGITRGLLINPTLTAAVDFRSIEVNNGRVMFNQPSLVSTPAQQFTGAWHTGSGTTNTKPHVLIEPSGAVSTAWSTNGTGLGVNAANLFGGNLVDLQVNGSSRFAVASSGSLTTSASASIGGNIIGVGNVLGGATGFIGIANRTGFNSSTAGLLNILNQFDGNFERLQLGGATSLFPALQVASSNAQTGIAATFTNGSDNIVTVANTFAAGQVVQFTTTGTLPTGFTTGTNYFIVGTPTSTQTGLTATFTNGDVNITTAINNYSAGDVVQFTSTGTLPTGFALATNYYVIATGLTTTNIQLSATFNGSAITAASAGSGVQTVTRQPMFTVSATTGGAAISAASAGTAPWTVVRQTSATITNGTSTWTSTFAHGLRVGDVIRFSGTLPTGYGTNNDYYVLTIPSTTTFTVGLHFNGVAVAAGSVVTTAIIFTRNPGIYTRTADNSTYSQLYTGNLVVTAPLGFAGSVLDARVGTTAVFNVSNGGNIATNGQISAGGSVIAAASQYFSWGSNKSLIGSPADGTIVISNNGLTGFDYLHFGGVTASFPTIKRVSTELEFKLADNTAYTSIRAQNFITGAASGYLQLGNIVLQGTTGLYNTASTNVRLTPLTTGVVVQANGATGAASAILQANSTTQGFLPPRMTTTEKNAIATPAQGLIVFDTTLVKLCVYNGSAWETITSI